MRIEIEYFAILREQAGQAGESLELDAATPVEVYRLLAERHGFAPGHDRLRVAVNDAFADWHTPLADGDRLVFIPPVAGG